MNIETQIRAWKSPEFRAGLDEELAPNPAGNRLLELDETEIQAIWGAQDRPDGVPSSEGYICGVSGEVTGQSCWEILA